MATPMGTSAAQTPSGKPSTETRWMLGIRGVLAILFGFIVWTWPGITLRVLVMVFGIFAIAAGIFVMLAGVRSGDARGRWFGIIEGVLAILAGIIALAWPAITAVVLLFVIAIWAIATGIVEIISAFRTGRAAGLEWLLILSGVLSIIFGILLMVWPGAGLLALVWLIGIYAVVHGIFLLVHAFSGRMPGEYRTGYGQSYGTEPSSPPRASA